MKITKVTPNNISNFNKEIKTPGLIAFVKIYSNGCHHCKELEPKWNKMEDELKNENLEGLIVSLPYDLSDKADCDTDDVTGVPTLRVLQGGKKKFDYEGRRETEEMKSFVKNLLKKQKGGKRKKTRKQKRKKRKKRKNRRTRKKRGGLSKLGKLKVDARIASALRNAKDEQFSKDVIELLQGLHSTNHEEPEEQPLNMSELQLITKGGKRRTRKRRRKKTKKTKKRRR